MLFDLYKFHLLVWENISPKTKKTGYLGFFFQIVLGFSELLFAYIIFSILSIITNTNQSLNIEINNNLNSLISYLFLSIIVITILRVIVSKMINVFAFNSNKEIGIKFFYEIINLDFLEIGNIDSSDYISTLTVRIYTVSYFYKIIMEITTAIFVFIFLFLSSLFFLEISIIYMILFLIIILLLSYLINLFLKKKAKSLSFLINKHVSNLQKILNDTSRFLKEIFLNNYYNIFNQKFIISSSNLFIAEGKLSYINSLPRIILEFLIMLIGVLLLFLFHTNENFLINLGFLFFLFLRLFPYLNIVNSNIVGLRGRMEIINVLSSFFYNFSKKQNLTNDQFNQIFKNNFFSLKIENLNFSYKENLILDKVNFQIKKNELLAITGKSGSGKTTLLNIICGFLKPSDGNIFINDHKVQILKNNLWQNKIAYVGQNIPIFDESLIYNITLEENFNFEKNKDKFSKILDLALIDWIHDEDQYYIKVGENGQNLSVGQKQRLALARALYLKNKEILIFDEITSALDFKNEELLIKNFKTLKSKYTIISVTHRKAILEIADQVLDLK